MVVSRACILAEVVVRHWVEDAHLTDKLQQLPLGKITPEASLEETRRKVVRKEETSSITITVEKIQCRTVRKTVDIYHSSVTKLRLEPVEPQTIKLEFPHQRQRVWEPPSRSVLSAQPDPPNSKSRNSMKHRMTMMTNKMIQNKLMTMIARAITSLIEMKLNCNNTAMKIKIKHLLQSTWWITPRKYYQFTNNSSNSRSLNVKLGSNPWIIISFPSNSR